MIPNPNRGGIFLSGEEAESMRSELYPSRSWLLYFYSNRINSLTRACPLESRVFEPTVLGAVFSVIGSQPDVLFFLVFKRVK